jgi:UDP-N-acetylglucosamine acyltransferase
MIHPTAIVHPKAEVDPTTEVGPYAIIDSGVRLGPHCRVGPHVHLTGNTVIGAHNVFFAGCVVGEAPQDLKYRGAPSRLRIGDHNVFREHMTAHRATDVEEDTVVGSHNLLMAHCHIAHNCQLGNYIILASGALMAGHVVIGDRAIISGNCLIHQFVRIGPLSLMQGGTAISKDLPPYTIATGRNTLCGLNVIGLRRHGFTSDQRLELKCAYRTLFRDGLLLKQALDAARQACPSEAARVLIEFVAASERGVCHDPGSRYRAEADDNE